MTGFLERIGGPLVVPHRAMRRAVEERAGRGAADVGVVVLLAWFAEQLPVLVHAVFRGLELGVGAGFHGLLAGLSALMPIVLGIMIASLIMSVLAGRPPARKEGATPHADAVDLSAYAVLPFIFVTALADLMFSARGVAPSENAAKIVFVIALAWSIVAWSFGLIALREQRSKS
jgi:hypothetical protein